MMMASILPKQPSKTFQSGRLASKQGLGTFIKQKVSLENSIDNNVFTTLINSTVRSPVEILLPFQLFAKLEKASCFLHSLILASPIIGKNERRRTTPLLLMWNGSWMQSQQKKKAPLREGSCFYYSRELSLSGQHDIWMGRRFQGYTARDSLRRRS